MGAVGAASSANRTTTVLVYQNAAEDLRSVVRVTVSEDVTALQLLRQVAVAINREAQAILIAFGQDDMQGEARGNPHTFGVSRETPRAEESYIGNVLFDTQVLPLLSSADAFLPGAKSVRVLFFTTPGGS